MKRLEALFSAMSFLVALVAGVLLLFDAVAAAVVTAWGGTAVAALGYASTSRLLRRD